MVNPGKSSIKPPGGGRLFILSPFGGGGGLNRDGVLIWEGGGVI